MDEHCQDAASKFASLIDLFIYRIEYRSRPHIEYYQRDRGIYREIVAVEFERDGYVLRVEPNDEAPFNTVKWSERKLEQSVESRHYLDGIEVSDRKRRT